MKQHAPYKVMALVQFARQYALRIGVVTLFVGWLLYFVSSIPEQAALVEVSTATESASLSTILDNPINAPYKLAAFIFTSISSSILAIRAVSLIMLAMTATSLYYTVKLWHTKSVAAIVTGLFCANSVVLATSRLGAPLVTVFGWFIFTSLVLWQVHGNSNKIIPGSVLLTVALLLYTPGALWFLLVFMVFYWDRIRLAFKYVRPKSVIIGSLLGLLVCAPLIVAFTRDLSVLREWMLLPEVFSVRILLESLLEVPSSFLYRTPENALLNVATLPVFDLASGFLFLFGAYAYSKKTKLDRTRLMIAVILVAVIIGSFGDTYTAIVVLLPFAYSIIAAGIEYLLDEWWAVFPRNPFAKSFGVLIVTTVALFGSYYQLTRFLIAWPQAPETRSVYSQPRIIEPVIPVEASLDSDTP